MNSVNKIITKSGWDQCYPPFHYHKIITGYTYRQDPNSFYWNKWSERIARQWIATSCFWDDYTWTNFSWLSAKCLVHNNTNIHLYNLPGCCARDHMAHP